MKVFDKPPVEQNAENSITENQEILNPLPSSTQETNDQSAPNSDLPSPPETPADAATPELETSPSIPETPVDTPATPAAPSSVNPIKPLDHDPRDIGKPGEVPSDLPDLTKKKKHRRSRA